FRSCQTRSGGAAQSELLAVRGLSRHWCGRPRQNYSAANRADYPYPENPFTERLSASGETISEQSATQCGCRRGAGMPDECTAFKRRHAHGGIYPAHRPDPGIGEKTPAKSPTVGFIAGG